MHIVKNIIKNFSFLSFGQGVSGILNFFAVIFLARRLGVDSFGVFSFVESTLLFFMMFVIFGTDFLGSRAVAQDELHKQEYVREIVFFRFLLSLLAFFAVVILAIFLKKALTIKITLIIFGFSLFCLIFLLNWLFLGLQRLLIVALGDIIRESIFFFGIMFFINRETDIIKVGVVFFFSRLIHAIFLLVKYWREFSFPPALPFKLFKLKKLFKDAFPIFFSSLEGWIITCFDIVILGMYFGSKSVGYYNAAFKPVFLMISVCAVYYLSIFPMLSKASRFNEKDFKKIIGITLYGMLSLWLPVVIIGFQSSSWVIFKMYSHAYADSVPIFQCLIFTLIIVPVNALYSRSLISCGAQKSNSYVSLIIIVSNILLNFLLIPAYGPMGAAIAKVGAWGIALPFYFWYLSRHVKLTVLHSVSGPFLAASSMLMAFFISNRLSLGFRVMFEALVYLVIIMIITYYWWKREERRTSILTT